MPDEIESLRAEIKRLRKAVTRKVYRLKHNADVHLTGTSFDPRRAARSETKYTAPELRSYAQEMSRFLDRGNQFVADRQNRPIPRQEWREYKALESQVRDRVNSYFERVQDLVLPGPSQETIRQRMAKMVPDHLQMYNPAVNAPYRPPDKQPHQIDNRGALQKMKDSMRKRLEPDYFERHNEAGMDQFIQMAEIINEPDLVEDVRGLNSEQFAILWNYTAFPTAISLQYEAAQKMLSDKERPWHTESQAQAVKDARALTKWAKTLKLGG